MIDHLSFDEFAARFCERQDYTPHQLHATLRAQVERYQPTGWMLLECHDMCSSNMGRLYILPYGPRNRFTEPPSYPISPTGDSAANQSVVVALLPAQALEVSK